MRRLIILLFLSICVFNSNVYATALWEVTNIAELYQAITDLKTNYVSSGGTIILAPGTYLMSETVEFNGINNINIVGSGWNTIWQKVGNGDAIVFSNSSFSIVRDMKIIGDLSMTTGSGIIFKEGSSNCLVNYCRIRMFPASGIYFQGTVEQPLFGNVVEKTHFIGNRQDQLYCFYNNEFTICCCQFGTHSATPITGALLDHCNSVTYSQNYHWSNEVAFKMKASNNCRFENNRFEMSNKEGIIIGEPNNTDSCTNNVFTGNTIHTNSMSLSGGYTAVVAFNAKKTTFSSNQVFSWNSANYKTKRCLELLNGCYNWIVTDNTMKHNATEPALLYNINDTHIVKGNITD